MVEFDGQGRAAHSGKPDLKQWKWYLTLPILVVAIIAMTFVLRDDHSSKAASVQPQSVTKQCINALGKLVEVVPMMDGHTKLGELDLYQNKSTGYSCAVTLAFGPTEGKTKVMHAWIGTCKEKKPTNNGCTVIKSALDNGNYKYEAGPVGVSSKGHCIAVVAAIVWHEKDYMASLNPYVSHCS